jgi:hypothetical protein
MLIAVTRLRLRSARFLLPFLWYALRSARQARGWPGNRGTRFRRSCGLRFWTVTAWQEEAALNAYRVASPHREAMPRLLGWCDEAALAHWQQENDTLPTWEEAAARLRAGGRLSKVQCPSPDQRAGRIVAT